MNPSSRQSSISSSRSLASRPSQNLSQLGFDSIDLMYLDPMQRTSSTSTISSLPSMEDLDRMERWIELQERATNLNTAPRQGHVYGKLAVSGNARAIRGNIYEDNALLSDARSHTYGAGLAINGGVIMEGDISLTAFNDVKRQSPSSNSSRKPR